MIVNFSVQNFGSIKDKQVLSFEADKSSHLEDYYIIDSIDGLRLLKLGLIYGANASGKTTILKSLDFLRNIVLNPEDKKTESFDFKPFLFDEFSPKVNSILSMEFIQNKTRYFYEVELNQKAVVKETLFHYNPKKSNVFKRVTDLDKQFTQISFGSKIKKDKTFEKTLEANTLWNNTVLGGFLKTNIKSNELKDAVDWFENFLNPLIYTGTQLDNYVTKKVENSKINKNDIINILRKADFNISDIILKEDSDKMPEKYIKFLTALEMPEEEIEKIINTPLKKIEFEHTINNIKYFIPIDQESQGTQRYYGFSGLLSLLINESIAIPIDELESSLHPDLFEHFIVSFLINAKNSQIIATTHNREILNNKDIFRNDAIWFTNKTEKSATELYSLSDFDTSIVRDTSNIYNAYKIGKLGGVPNLGDYYIDSNNEKK
jgi:AAA15 family ATPase/GTPase